MTRSQVSINPNDPTVSELLFFLGHDEQFQPRRSRWYGYKRPVASGEERGNEAEITIPSLVPAKKKWWDGWDRESRNLDNYSWLLLLYLMERSQVGAMMSSLVVVVDSPPRSTIAV